MGWTEVDWLGVEIWNDVQCVDVEARVVVSWSVAESRCGVVCPALESRDAVV